jgi:hypothetical protein
VIEKIVERIISYSASVSKPVSCVEFGVANLPQPPYVVVKQEQDPGGAGMQFRIISHFAPGQQSSLRQFNRTTIGQALNDFKATSATGVYNKLNYDWNSYDSRISPNDDGTISSERLYYMGDRI